MAENDPRDVPVNTANDKPAASRGRDLFTSLHDEADRLFREFSRAWTGSGLRSVWGAHGPVVDVIEREGEIEVHAELPGIEENDIDIEIAEDTLTIRAEKRETIDEADEDSRYHLSERRYGSYQRTLTVPEGADLDRAEARFGNGVLTVTFPKTEATKRKPRKVEVKSA